MRPKFNVVKKTLLATAIIMPMLGYVGLNASTEDYTSEDATPKGVDLQSKELAPALVDKTHEEYLRMVERGKELWHDRTLGNNGLNCVMCHPNGAVTHSETYPKYKAQFGRVVSEQEFINWCIVVALQGKNYELGSEELTALEVYQNYANRGEKIDVGAP